MIVTEEHVALMSDKEGERLVVEGWMFVVEFQRSWGITWGSNELLQK